MKKIGIVGGEAWLSTVDYYSHICRRSEELHAARGLKGIPATPEISIESLDLRTAVSYISRDDHESSWQRFDDYHRDALLRLQASGVEIALIASNTPHHRFEAIVRDVRIPVINLFEVVAEACASVASDKALILGTALTMQSSTFRSAFARRGIDADAPSSTVRNEIIELISRLQMGQTAGGAEQIGRAVRDWTTLTGTAPVACLACTELPLAFGDLSEKAIFKFNGVTFINSSAAHIDALCNIVLTTLPG